MSLLGARTSSSIGSPATGCRAGSGVTGRSSRPSSATVSATIWPFLTRSGLSSVKISLRPRAPDRFTVGLWRRSLYLVVASFCLSTAIRAVGALPNFLPLKSCRRRSRWTSCGLDRSIAKATSLPFLADLDRALSPSATSGKPVTLPTPWQAAGGVLGAGRPAACASSSPAPSRAWRPRTTPPPRRSGPRTAPRRRAGGRARRRAAGCRLVRSGHSCAQHRAPRPVSALKCTSPWVAPAM